MARALAAEAYAAGARYVDVAYGDQQVRRAHIAGASDEMLDWSPPWVMRRIGDLGEGGALIAIMGNPDPDAFAGLDGARVAGARMARR